MSYSILKAIPGNCRLCNTRWNYDHHISGKIENQIWWAANWCVCKC